MWKLTKWNQTNYIFLYLAKEITKTLYHDEFNEVIKQNGYYIYEFWE